MSTAYREAPSINSSMYENTDLAKVLEWLSLTEESTGEVEFRRESKEDYRFYAGDQDDDDVKEYLAQLNRPCTVHNEILPKVNVLIGLAAQTKHEPSIVPTSVEDGPLAELVWNTVKHYRNKIKLSDIELECFEHTVKVGRSLLYFYLDASNPFSPVIKAKRIPGGNFYLDPSGQEYDLSDHRFLFIEKYLTQEEIELIWGKDKFNAQSVPTRDIYKLDFYDEISDKYRILEVWYKVKESVLWFRNPITGKEDSLPPEKFKDFTSAISKGIVLPDGRKFQSNAPIETTETLTEKVKYMIFSGNNILDDGYSPYNFTGFPAVLYGAYKNDNENRWFGIITEMKDPQRELNTIRRQLVHLLQTLPKGMLVHENGAVLNIEEYEQSSSKPNFHLVVEDLNKVKVESQPQISNVWGELDRMLIESIKDTGGVQDTMLGTHTTSREAGVTYKAKQETNLAVLYVLFSNFKRSRLRGDIIFLNLIQQYVNEPQLIRITGSQGQQLLEINTQINPQAQGFNDISTGEYDLVIDEITELPTTIHAIGQMLMEFSHNNPGSIPTDVITEYSGLPYSVTQKIAIYQAQISEANRKAKEFEQKIMLMEAEAKLIAAKAKANTANKNTEAK
jgi:hypothetical protein